MSDGSDMAAPQAVSKTDHNDAQQELNSSKSIRSEVVQTLEPLLTTLPAEKKREALRIISQSIQYQGPLPPPEMMEAYGRVIHDGPNRLMVLLEKQTDHRIAMETQMIGAKVSSTKLGQYFAAALSVFFGAIAGVLGYTGHDALAGTICVTTIVGLAVVFVLGKEPGKKEITAKSDEPAIPKKPSVPRRKKN